MKPEYKNWMPKGMIYAGAGGTGAFLALYLVVRLSGQVSAGWRTALLAIGLAGMVPPAVFWALCAVCAACACRGMGRGAEDAGQARGGKEALVGLDGQRVEQVEDRTHQDDGHQAHRTLANGLDVFVLGHLGGERHELLVEESHECVVLRLWHEPSPFLCACAVFPSSEL